MLQLSEVTIGYPGKILATGINLLLKRGDVVILEGPNGAGKSTLGRVVLGELKPLTGKRDNSFNRISYVPQKSVIDTRYPISLGELVAFGFRSGWWPVISPAERKRQSEKAEEALFLVGLINSRHLSVSVASGGQLQRALLARALVSNPEFILLDEPFSNLDRHGRQDISNLLQMLNETHKTTLFIIDHQNVAAFSKAQHLILENQVLRIG